jgi:hypothetical protein
MAPQKSSIFATAKPILPRPASPGKPFEDPSLTPIERLTMQLAHNVFFKLKDQSPARVDELVAACKKYLNVQPGIVFFAAGKVCKELNRDVNDLDWDVGLHLIFKDKASHDSYQDDPTHIKFIEEQKHNWAKVRVFDSLV